MKRNDNNPRKELERTLISMIGDKQTFIHKNFTAKQLQKDSTLRMMMYYLQQNLKK